MKNRVWQVSNGDNGALEVVRTVVLLVLNECMLFPPDGNSIHLR